jgi:hypothetical protein
MTAKFKDEFVDRFLAEGEAEREPGKGRGRGTHDLARAGGWRHGSAG